MPAEQHSCQKCAQNVYAPEKKPDASASVYACARDAEKKGRPCVVAEAEKPLCLLPRDAAAFIKLHRHLRTRGVPAEQTERQRGRACSAHMKQRAHHRRKQPRGNVRERKLRHERRADEKRKQRRQNDAAAKPKTLYDRAGRDLRVQQQRRCRRQERQKIQCLAKPRAVFHMHRLLRQSMRSRKDLEDAA